MNALDGYALRVAVVVALGAASVVVPWWLVMLVMVVCFFAFSYFIEGVAIALYMDMLLSQPEQSMLLSLIGVGLFFAVQVVKRFIR